MNHQTKNFETQIAFFLQKTNNQIEKKFKKSYEHLFQPNIFSKLLKINHEYIIKLYEINEINKTLTYEYFESISLREKLKLDNNIDFITLKKILQDIAISIDYLHQNNIAHIDINDTNILINTSFEVKLNDFDFIEILNQKNQSLKQIDILAFAILVYRLIQLPYQWNAINHMKFKYSTKNIDYSSCINFLTTLRLK
jgi:serine/threonine protein kinase